MNQQIPRSLRTQDFVWRVIGALFIGAWLAGFAGRGLMAPFSGDDLMNLHGYLTKPAHSLLLDNARYWSSAYRPLGGLFYVSLYRLSGFDPLSFRIACFALLGLNLLLLFWFSRLVSKSAEVAFLATFLVSYHACFVDLYFSSGTVYELLCFAFYFGAFIFYVRIRHAGRLPSRLESLILVILYICALNAKEMAVTLPLFLAIYEWLYHRPRMTARSVRTWPIREGRAALIAAVLTIPYVVGKLTLPGGLMQSPAYRLSISPGRFLDTFHLYLNAFLYQDHVFRDPNTVQLLLAMLILAMWRRSPVLLFGWSFLLLTLLPVAFMAHYAGFLMYVPSVGWALYAAGVLVALKNGVLRAMARLARWSRHAIPRPEVARLEMIGRVTLVVVVACALAPLHARESPRALRHFLSVQPPAREIAAELRRVQPQVRRGARVLFVDDPFPKDEHFLLFLTRLVYNDMSIYVTRTAVQPCGPAQYGKYDVVLVYRQGRLEAVGS